MAYCPWCREEFDHDLFCTDCGKPVALKAQPAIRTMIKAGSMPDRWVRTTQRRLISTVYSEHQDQILQGLKNTVEAPAGFAAEERSRMLEQKDEVKNRFQRFKEQAEEGRYAPEKYR